jgi:xanthine dehydrogenase YagR molybdenum-binding subunit
MRYIGKEMRRVDGIAKVTGRAKYAAEFEMPNVAYGYLTLSTIAKGTITAIDTSEAEKASGVLQIFTHLNAPKLFPAPPGGGGEDTEFKALMSPKIVFSGQPVAVAVANTFEEARYASQLIKVTYDEQKPATDLRAAIDSAREVNAQRSPKPRGDFASAFASAPVKVEQEYNIPIEHHNPIEPQGATAFWKDGKLTIFDKTQDIYQLRDYLADTFKIAPEDVNVIALFVGGAFGSSLNVNYYPPLVALAAREVKRPVRLVYTRRQMFTGHGYRPDTWQKIAISAEKDGKLTAISHRAVINTSTFEDYVEDYFKVARTLYKCPNVETLYQNVAADLPTPAAMRAPAAVSNMFALECALDELSYQLKIDPLELRLINYAETEPETDKPFSSKALRECYSLAAEKFGWKNRSPEPRSMRDGNLLVGWGTATGLWGAFQQPASAKIVYKSNGTAHVTSSTTDIGPGTYTVMTIIAAEYLGLDPAKIKFELGNSTYPKAPSQGGSQTTASVGSAIFGAAQNIRQQLLDLAKKEASSPLASANADDVELSDGALRLKSDPSKTADIVGLLQKNGLQEVSDSYDSKPSPERQKYATGAHGAQFVEVKVDPQLGTVRVTRVIEATACGRIMNPKTSHSQEIGGVIWGIGMALMEGTEVDHRYGRMLNPTLADYHVPVHADAHQIETVFVEEDDKIVNPLGVKGMGELGLVGIPAAIANAVYHATGIRVRDLPITPDKLINGGLDLDNAP